jgi:hypothetical protein
MALLLLLSEGPILLPQQTLLLAVGLLQVLLLLLPLLWSWWQVLLPVCAPEVQHMLPVLLPVALLPLQQQQQKAVLASVQSARHTGTSATLV